MRLLGTSPESIPQGGRTARASRTPWRPSASPCVTSDVVESVEAAVEFAGRIGYPVIVRPAYTLGALAASPTTSLLREIADRGIHLSRWARCSSSGASPAGREIEFEVMRDSAGNAIQICSMENIDPVGVHTGDSIVVATPPRPWPTGEYQMPRSASLNIITSLASRAGSTTGPSTPTPEYAVIEVNPRVSPDLPPWPPRPPATPIAKVAAQGGPGLHPLTRSPTR